MNTIFLRLIFLMISVGGGLVIGANNKIGVWYDSLLKSALTPPPLAFPIAWTVLYVLIGLVGFRVFQQRHKTILFKIWYCQLLLNFCWSPLFFVKHDIVAALLVLVGLLVMIIWFMKIAFQIDRPSFWMFIPYVLWVSFAAYLNGVIAYLN